MSKTKIVVIRLKELIYTAIFVGLGILLIILLVVMFWPNKKDTTSSDNAACYTPGKYSSQISLNDTSLNIEVVVDSDHINSIQIVNLDEAITTMFPLVKPSLDAIMEQLSNGVALEDITFDQDSKYTQQFLLQAIQSALDKAMITQ